MKPGMIRPLALLGLAAGLVFFQNCADPRLERLEEPVRVLATPTLDLKANICSQARFSGGDSSKFVFIMDLSASNFGNWKSEKLGGQNLFYWDPSQATDPRGDRFEAVKYFLENCGNQQGNQFAFIGFSNAAGVLENNKFSCDAVAFGDKEQTAARVNALKSRQAQDETWYKRWIKPAYLTEAQPDSLIYGVTNYTAASKCLERLILDDLTQNTANTTDRYNIFFISDGVPQDKNGTGCNKTHMSESAKFECHMQSNLSSIALTRTAALSKGKKLTIQGIYYGDAESGVPVVLDALSREGGSADTIKLGDFRDQRALCDLVVTQNAIEYRPDLYTALNMTVRRAAGELKADSDMDGLLDDAERALGYDPQNPRSAVPGVLDSICERLGGVATCQERRAQVTCDPDDFDALGMTDCDHKILGLHLLPGQLERGVDSDRDGLPDFVEIVKGTDPARADMTLDPDGDGVITRDEILRGTDPYFPDADLDPLLLNHNQLSFRVRSDIPACRSGDWELHASHLQVTRTLEVQDFPDELAVLRHARNGQVVLMLHRLTPVNSISPVIEYYGQYVPVSARGKVGAEILEASPNRLGPADFLSLGRINP